MDREDLGNGAEYIDGPRIGVLRRRLTAAHRKKLETFLYDARTPGKHGLSGKERWALYSLGWFGIDVKDLVVLTWGEIDLSNHAVTVKGSSVVMPEKLCAQLSEMRGGNGAARDERVFPGLRDTENPASVMDTMFQSDCRKAGLDLPHQGGLGAG
jgi:hypothetical protein